MDNYIKATIHRMARATNTVLTGQHKAILEYAYKYYEKNKVPPLYYNFKKHMGVSREKINLLFPHGLYSILTWTGAPVQTANNPCNHIAMVEVANNQEVYLDNNSTTFIRPEVSRILVKYYSGKFGFANPSSSTMQGQKAYDLIYSTRQSIAQCLSVKPEEIVFTGSGSEANNLAIKGIAFKRLNTGGHIITSEIEHPSVLKTLKYLETLGFTVSYLKPESDGRIHPDFVKDAIKKDTILVSIMAVNNEIGAINPIGEIGALCRDKNIPFIVDAIQGFGKIPLKPVELGISLLSFSGHKIYAPKGIGGLFVDHNLHMVPLIHGGDQEMGIRAGTENVGQIIALGEAAKLAHAEMEKEKTRFIKLRNFFLTELRKIEPEFLINGSIDERIPNNLSIAFPGVDSRALVLSLNAIGICVSAGSACSSGAIEISHVLKAIGVDTLNYGVIRFGFGLTTSKEELEYLFRYLPEILEQLKKSDPNPPL